MPFYPTAVWSGVQSERRAVLGVIGAGIYNEGELGNEGLEGEDGGSTLKLDLSSAIQVGVCRGNRPARHVPSR